jgi:hypothetical protein
MDVEVWNHARTFSRTFFLEAMMEESYGSGAITILELSGCQYVLLRADQIK